MGLFLVPLAPPIPSLVLLMEVDLEALEEGCLAHLQMLAMPGLIFLVLIHFQDVITGLPG